MAVLEWSPSLSVGVAQIDSQHKELIARINGLLQAMLKGQGKSEVAKVLAYLESYVVTHFQAEQKIMLQHAYPGYLQHKAQHDAFIADVTAIKEQFEREGPNAGLVIQIQHRVCDWTVNHIGQVDQKLGAYLKAQA